MGLTPSPDGRRGSVLFSIWLLSLTVFLLPPIWALIAIVPAGRAARRIVRACARRVLLLTGCPLSVSGLEHLRGEPCVVMVANHSSYLDVVVLLAAIPHDYRFVANHLAGTRPLVGLVIRKEGHLLVDRGSAASRVDSARRMARTLEEGTSLLVFPEGTRSAGALRRFTSGAFRAAMRTGRPIMPIAIAGTAQILPRRASLGRPSVIEVTVLPPIPTGTGTRANAVDLGAAAAHAITAERLAQAAYYRERVHGTSPWPPRWRWAFVEPHR